MNRADASGPDWEWEVNEQKSRPRAILTRHWPGANDMQPAIVSSVCCQGRDGIVGGGIKISIGERA